jgi:hypothetical protein
MQEGVKASRAIRLVPERLVLIALNATCLATGVVLATHGAKVLGALLMVRPVVITVLLVRRWHTHRDTSERVARPATEQEIKRLTTVPAQTIALALLGAFLAWAGDAPVVWPMAFLVESVIAVVLLVLRRRQISLLLRDGPLLYRPAHWE